MLDDIYMRDMDEMVVNIDAWNENFLIDAYQRALIKTNDKVAQDIAMATNSNGSKLNTSQRNPSIIKRNDLKWKIGQSCRAVYTEDGEEYEAIIQDITGEHCVVSFLGYNNEEKVPLKSLKETGGKKKRNKQMKQARMEEKIQSLYTSMTSEEMSESDRTTAVSERSSGSRRRKQGNKRSRSSLPGQDKSKMHLPPIPPFPNFQMPRMPTSIMPIPPPTPCPLSSGNAEENAALTAMLTSWYMSGWYMGMYQNMDRSNTEK